MTISQRVESIIKIIENDNKKKFLDKTGIKGPTLSRAINRNAHLRSDTVEAILKAYPEVDARWLLTGEGSMYARVELPEDEEITDSDTLKNLNLLVELLQKENERLQVELGVKKK